MPDLDFQTFLVILGVSAFFGIGSGLLQGWLMSKRRKK